MSHTFENDFQANVIDNAARASVGKTKQTRAITNLSSTCLNDSNDENNVSITEINQITLSNLSKPVGRSKMFNNGFKIYKRREIVPSVNNFKCGQKTECVVSFIESPENFYVQKKSRIKDLNDFESCIQNYANVLLNDDGIRSSLYSFQNNVAQYDVVLVKSKLSKKWQRAIFLGKSL